MAEVCLFDQLFVPLNRLLKKQKFGWLATHFVIILCITEPSVPPEIGYVSSDQDVCEGSLVTLSCNATGKPTPNITWTRVADGVQLPAVDGNYVMSNIQRSSNGTYRCTADNGAGDPVNRTVQVRVRCSPSVDRIVNSSNTVNEGGSLYMTCEASGDPPPHNYTWKRSDTNEVVADGNMLNFTSIKRNNTGWYRCEATNQCGTGSGLQFVVVYYPPKITYVVGNQTANVKDEVSLDCTADGNPAPSITWTRLSDNSVVSSPLTITGKHDEGYYRCTADNVISSPDSRDVFVSVQNYHPTHPPSLTTNLSDNTVVMGESFTLNCSAQANPPAKYRFYKEQQSLFNTTAGSNFAVYPTSVSERKTPVIFTCIPFNDYGDGPTQTITVTVHYPPTATEKCHTIRMPEESSVSLSCPTDGNPFPNIIWHKGSELCGTMLSRGKKLKFSKAMSNNSGWYTCFANNSLGTVSVSLYLLIGKLFLEFSGSI